jgi:hypothetical protein
MLNILVKSTWESKQSKETFLDKMTLKGTIAISFMPFPERRILEMCSFFVITMTITLYKWGFGVTSEIKAPQKWPWKISGSVYSERLESWEIFFVFVCIFLHISMCKYVKMIRSICVVDPWAQEPPDKKENCMFLAWGQRLTAPPLIVREVRRLAVGFWRLRSAHFGSRSRTRERKQLTSRDLWSHTVRVTVDTAPWCRDKRGHRP